jgi:predicted Zn finger-like uncharacterized protein
VKFLCEQCKAKYQIADEKAAGKTVRMKCRKCGHLIEVRGVVGADPAPADPPATARFGVPIERAELPLDEPAPATKPLAPPPRAGAIRPTATSFAAVRPTEKSGGALAGALKSALQRDDEVSAPVDMSDLSPSDEWYVAINGVPVGPIRIAEVRRKAAIGAVTEESLCWQEGLEEWRALRSFPELAAIVREAFSSNRSSLTPPPPDARAHSAIPAQARMSRPSSPAAVPPRAPPARPASTNPPAPMARSNVVPITSRLATAERLAEPPAPLTSPAQPLRPSVVPDPFAGPAAPPIFAAATPSPAASPFANPPAAAAALPEAQALTMGAKKGPPWMAIAMVAAAVAFGVTVGLAFVLRPPPAPAPVVVQVPAIPTAAGGPAAPTATAATMPTADPVQSAPSAQSAVPRPGVAVASKTAAASVPASVSAPPSAVPSHGPLDLNGLRGGPTIAPTEDLGGGSSEGARAPGQCITGAQVQQVIQQHRVALQRACWERASQKPSANISVSLTIGADGAAQGVSASGDDASVAKCIESDVRGWHFPAMGCSTPTSIPFHFVRQ